MDNPSYTVELLRQQNIQDALSTSYDAIVFDEDCSHSFADDEKQILQDKFLE